MADLRNHAATGEMTFDESHRLMLIKIKPTTVLERGGSVYEAVRWRWRVSRQRVENADYVLAIVDGICRGAFVAVRWEADQATRRLFFQGHCAPAEVCERYMGKGIPSDMRKPGMASPVLYVNC